MSYIGEPKKVSSAELFLEERSSHDQDLIKNMMKAIIENKLTDYINDVVSSTGDLEKSKSKATTSISDYNDDRVKLQERVESIRERYMTQFSAMESAVTGFKKTGEFLTGFIDALSPKD